MKKTRRTRRVHTGTAVHGVARVQIGGLGTTVNINNPAAPVTTGAFNRLSCAFSNVKELVQRSSVYQKFRVRYIKYEFIRDKIATPQSIASAEYTGSQFMYVMKNTYNRVLPTPSATNNSVICAWFDQQTCKRVPIKKDRFFVTVPANVMETKYLDPIGTGTTIPVSTQRKCPWMQFSDLTDQVSYAQLVTYMPPIALATTIPVASTAGGVGPSAADYAAMFQYRAIAHVHYSCKGKFLDASLV